QEYALREYLDAAWALRPVDLVRRHGRATMVVEFSGGVRLDRLIGQGFGMGQFLRLAMSMVAGLGQLHSRGIIHKDIKPANLVADLETARVWYTGFGIASRLTRERHSPEPPELIAGTLAYMAPEQTGRVNRSIDSRSDLYSLGVSFYEMLTGQLPFAAADPMEWVHCHIARQPITPHERDAAIPPALSAIVMKLLAKTVEERYQTAKGIESDLAHCLAAWDAHGSIAPFELALSDTPDRLMIPEKLYGRDREIATLLAAFDRIVAGGRTELVLVSGYSGIGKSAVVNELHKPLVPPRGLFASGKFDQYKRDIPYATLAQAFQSLIRPLLSANEASLQQWRAVLQAAVEPNGLLMVDLVPELGHIIGEQPAVPALPPKEAKRRFQLVFRRFIAAFARPEHPLALFLDDLQWLDSATLDLLEDLLVSDDLQHLLLIGAYRDNEVSPTHPLLLKLEAIRCTGAPVHDIVLEPLACEDLGQLLGDTLRCDLAQAASLAALIHAKTTGNPFFSIQFIGALTDEGLLVFDYELGRWVWDLERILAKNFTDNVVELMVAKLRRLAPKTQLALRQFACMGNTASFDMLGMAYQGGSVQDMHRRLGEAVHSGLVFRAEDSYRFLHDRVQEASYSQIPPSERAEAHLRIGLLLAAHTPSAKIEEGVFEIVNQLNRGAHLLRAGAELVQVAQLNLIAGRRAKNATAYDAALKYLRVGSALLPESAWANHYALFFSIEFLIAECELMTMDMVAAEARLARLVVRAANRHDACLVTRLRLTLYTAMDQSDRGVDVFLDWLRQDGTAWSGHPTRADAMREYERIWTLLGARAIEELVDLPLSDDTDYIDTMEVFSEIVTPALFYDEHLFSLTLCRMVNLSLEHGNCDGSCFGYAWFAMAAGPQFDNYRDGYRFGQLGFDLVETRGLTRYQARMYITFSNAVVPWVRHVASERDLLDRAFDLAYRAGDLTFAAYRGEQIVANYLLAGDCSLPDLEREAENGLAFGQRVGFGYVIHNCNSQLGLIRSLRALNGHFGILDTELYTEAAAERDLASNPVLSLAEFCYWTRKLQARFFAGDFASATDAAARAQSLIWSAPGQIVTADFRFYAALAHAAYWHQAGDGERPAIIAALNVHHHQLEVWALHCPANFAERTALVRAEIARLEARQLEAQNLYEEAILLAHENGSIHNEALANELAGRYYAERGFKKIALVYLRDSCLYYTRWGAEAKTRQLRHDFPALSLDHSLAEGATTINAPVEHLDLATVLRISEAVSGEIVLEKLIDTLMRSAVEHAGAERGLLILPFEGDYRIEAEVITSAAQVQVQLRQSAIGAADLPQSVFRYALRTGDSVLLHDAMNASAFSDDDYVRERHARSVMCMPILKQSRLLGMLYLENNLAPSAFTPARIAILKLLASQAAVSMENARLYRDLAEREAKIRRLVDANIIGIVISAVDGRIIEANDAFLRIVGYNRDEFVARGVCWPKITPPEWLHMDEAFRMPELKLTGRLQPFEKEFFRKDGSRVPVLVGAARFEDESGQVVAFVLDLSERKRDAEALRALQMDLAYANRLATMGQLTASIAHEVNQPIGAMRNNAHAALRFLAASPPALADVGEALACVVDDTYRAHDIIKGIRDQVSKVPPRQDKVDLNEAIRNVIALVRGELSKHAITLQAQLAERLPPVHGDRIQLQQVVLNLIVNAIEAMAEGDRKGRILGVHSAMSSSGGVLVSVRDSGPGIAPEHHEQVFESFFTTKPGGVGIGLSICRTIIQAHGGKLWVDGDWPLGGAFDFTLPAVP
ncbi:MAG: AAA family ATPase, partial [Massilia sp.]